MTVTFLCDESGVTAVEYGLLAGAIAVTCVLGLTNVGAAINALWNNWVIPVIVAVSG
jgi:Flp pilus assembly pilin Flp